MKIALVHDYFGEYGGADRVLRVFADIFPKAPIYTAFITPGSTTYLHFKDRKVVESKFAWLIKRFRLYSPLRFLLPLIWGSMDLSDYDLVITSCSAYIARGFKVGEKTKVIAYCHTPPRNLYGLQTSINWLGWNWAYFWPAKIYAMVVNYFVRMFDFESAQKVDVWWCNSETVKRRIAKYYRREAKVIYPPIEVEKIIKETEKVKKSDYFLIVSRLFVSKGLEEAAQMAGNLKIRLKISGEAVAGEKFNEKLIAWGKGYVEMLGRLEDKEVYRSMAEAKGFIALARNEDFGMTVVEAMAAGTPVLALNSGGFRETVINGKTGILVEDTGVKALSTALKRFEKTKWNRRDLVGRAKLFSRERFVTMIKKEVDKYA